MSVTTLVLRDAAFGGSSGRTLLNVKDLMLIRRVAPSRSMRCSADSVIDASKD